MLTTFENDDILHMLLLNEDKKVSFDFTTKPTMILDDTKYRITKPLFKKIFLYLSKIYDADFEIDYMYHKKHKNKIYVDYLFKIVEFA